MAYKGLVLSHLDFGPIVLKPTSKANLLDRAQYSTLRTISGCMVSTPLNVLLPKFSEVSLEYRYLSYNILLSKMIINIPVYNIISELNESYNPVYKYCENKEPPYILLALNYISPNIYVNKIPPCFVKVSSERC